MLQNPLAGDIIPFLNYKISYIVTCMKKDPRVLCGKNRHHKYIYILLLLFFLLLNCLLNFHCTKAILSGNIYFNNYLFLNFHNEYNSKVACWNYISNCNVVNRPGLEQPGSQTTSKIIWQPITKLLYIYIYIDT